MKSSILLLLFLSLLTACNGSKESSSEEAEDLDQTLSTCNLYGPPSSLNFSKTQVEVIKNIAIPTVTATYNSALPVTFRTSPDLPAGVSISPLTGEVSGTPTVAGDRVYTLIAANQCGAVTFDLRIKVKDLPPSALSYPSPSYVINLGENFPTISPTVSGAPTLFTVSPSLPAGLSIEASTGTILGKPFESQVSTNYVITASNTGGSVATNLSIMIKGKAPQNLSYQVLSSTYKAGVESVANYPLYSGDAATTFSIAPALPLGLSINTSSGMLSGNAEEVRNNQVYTVTASNQWGSAQAQINLSVLAHVNALATGNEHTCLIKNRKVRCQGRNDLSQLGYPSSTMCQDISNDSFLCSREMKHVLINGEQLRASALALAANTSCALGVDSKVYCWGDNEIGQVGNYTNTSVAALPQAVKKNDATDLSGVKEIKAGLNHFCALTTSSEMYCWGDNSQTQLGLTGILSSNNAILVSSSVSGIALGTNHTCQLKNNTPSCVGSNIFYQLSNGSNVNASYFVDSLKLSGAFSSVSQIWAGDSFTLFKEGNKLFGAGRNSQGELGFSDLLSRPYAVEMNSLDIGSIVTGTNSFCYLLNGFGYCQGLNNNNFANATNIGSANPTPLEIMEDVSLPFVNIDLISQGYSPHRCVSRNGEAYCFGENYMGQVSSDLSVVEIYPQQLETP